MIELEYSDTVDRPLDYKVREYKNDKFRYSSLVPCFWCDKDLWKKVATVDHINPRWRGGNSDPNNLEISCYECNQDRRVVSILASRIRAAFQNRKSHNVNIRRRWLSEAFKLREKYLEHMLILEQVYHEKLTGTRLKHCLAEIDEILRAEMI